MPCKKKVHIIMFPEALRKTTSGISSREYSKWGYNGRESPTIPCHLIFFPGTAYTFWNLLKNDLFSGITASFFREVCCIYVLYILTSF